MEESRLETILRLHCERSRQSAAWPSGVDRRAFVRGWARDLGELGVTESELKGASRAVLEHPPRTAEEHRAAIRNAILSKRAGPAFVPEQRAAAPSRDRGRELALAELAQVYLNRQAWAELPVERRESLWGQAKSLIPPGVSRIRTFRERAAWLLAGFPDPAEADRTMTESVQTINALQYVYGAAYDPAPAQAPAEVESV